MPRHNINIPLEEEENESFQPERRMPYLEETDVTQQCVFIEAFLTPGRSTKLFKKEKCCQLSTADLTKLIFGNQGESEIF